MEFLENQKAILQEIMLRYGDKMSDECMKAMHDDMVGFQEVANRLAKYESVLDTLANENMELGQHIADLEAAFEGKPAPEPQAPAEEATVEEEFHADDLQENIEQMEKPPSPTAVEEAEPVEQYSSFIFDYKGVWAKLEAKDKAAIVEDIKSLANGDLSKAEIEAIKYLASSGKYVFDDITKDGGDWAYTFKSAVNSLHDKSMVEYQGEYHQFVFLTQRGLWFYALVFKDSPVAFRKVE